MSLEKFKTDVKNALMAGSLCMALLKNLKALQQGFDEESQYHQHLTQSIRDLERCQALLDNLGENLFELAKAKPVGESN